MLVWSGMGDDAFGRGDIDGLLNLLDDNVEWITPGPSDLPVAGTRRGRQAVGEFFKALTETFETLDFQAKEFLAQGRSRRCLWHGHVARQGNGKSARLQLGPLVRHQERQDRSTSANTGI